VVKTEPIYCDGQGVSRWSSPHIRL